MLIRRGEPGSTVLPENALVAGRYRVEACIGRGGAGAVYRSSIRSTAHGARPGPRKHGARGLARAAAAGSLIVDA
jgi:hypothetical protein